MAKEALSLVLVGDARDNGGVGNGGGAVGDEGDAAHVQILHVRRCAVESYVFLTPQSDDVPVNINRCVIN